MGAAGGGGEVEVLEDGLGAAGDGVLDGGAAAGGGRDQGELERADRVVGVVAVEAAERVGGDGAGGGVGLDGGLEDGVH